MLGSLSTRLKNIDPSLKQAIREVEFNVKTKETVRMDLAQGLLKKVSKMSKQQQAQFDLAAKNGDEEWIQKLAKEHGFEDDLVGMRGMLDELYQEGTNVGYDFGYQQGYFPRIVSDPDGMLKKFGTDPAMIDALTKASADLGRELTKLEKAEVLNRFLRGYNRVIDFLDPETNKFYMPTNEALGSYIRTMTSKIEAAKFFGKHFKRADLGGYEVEDTVGAYVNDLLAKGKLSWDDEEKLQNMLNAYFNPARTSDAVGLSKNLTYLLLLGKVSSAATQIADLGMSAYKNGVIQTGKSIISPKKITQKELGIEDIAEEFSDNSKLRKVTETVFKLTGFERLVRLGKETFVNASFQKLSKQAKKNSPRLDELLSKSFEPERSVL